MENAEPYKIVRFGICVTLDCLHVRKAQVIKLPPEAQMSISVKLICTHSGGISSTSFVIANTFSAYAFFASCGEAL